jgi:hypothetical protein
MKNYAIKELVDLSYNGINEFKRLGDYFKALSKLTGNVEYQNIYDCIEGAVESRLSKEINRNIIPYILLNNYDVVIKPGYDEEGDEIDVYYLVDLVNNKEYSLVDFPNSEYFREHNTTGLENDYQYSLSTILRIMDSEAYKMICNTNEKDRLDFEMHKKDGIIKRMINKI